MCAMQAKGREGISPVGFNLDTRWSESSASLPDRFIPGDIPLFTY